MKIKMKEETKMKFIAAIIVVVVAGWCFIPCIWAIDQKFSGNDHFVESWIYAFGTSIALVVMLYFVCRSVKKRDKDEVH